MSLHLLDSEGSEERAEETAGGKGSDPFFFSEGRTGRVEILYTLSSGGECSSQDTHKRIISSTTFQEKAINMLFNILVS